LTKILPRFPCSPLVYGALLGIAAIAFEFALPPYPRFIFGQFAVLVIITLGVNLLLGVAGLLSLASPAFVGIGANLSTAIMLRAHLPILVSIPISVAAGWCIGWILGIVSLRLAGFYLAMVTFGFLDVFLVILNEGGDYTGGGYGLIVPTSTLPVIGNVTLDVVIAICAFSAGLLLVLVNQVQRSRIGRAWLAIKDEPIAAEIQGIDVPRMKTLAFAVSSALATLAGTYQALLLGVTNPSAYSLNVAVAHLTYVVVGGMTASVIGPVVGPFILFVIPELFRAIGQYREIFYGAILLLVLIVAPNGITGTILGLARGRGRPGQ
jgi:branched-chain amino acid transport system permease protein